MISKFNEHLFEQALLPASTLPNAKGKRKGQGADEGCSHLKVRPQGGPCKWKKGKWMFLAVPQQGDRSFKYMCCLPGLKMSV